MDDKEFNQYSRTLLSWRNTCADLLAKEQPDARVSVRIGDYEFLVQVNPSMPEDEIVFEQDGKQYRFKL